MTIRILATAVAFCVLIGPGVCGALCAALEGGDTAAVAAAGHPGSHESPCHGESSAPGQADPSGSQELPPCCLDAGNGSAVTAASDLPQRLLARIAPTAAVLTGVAEATDRAPSSGESPPPEAPYRRSNPPLLI